MAVQATGTFIFWDGKFLLLHRNPEKFQGHKWGLVGGKIEQGESPVQGAMREVEEEIGLHMEPSLLTQIGEHRLEYPEQEVLFFSFRYDAPEAFEPALDELENYGYTWVTLKECMERDALMDGLYQLLSDADLITKLS